MKLKNSGFLLAEAVFSVLVTLLLVILLENLLMNLKTANKASHHTDDIAFAYVQFNRFLHDDGVKTTYTVPKFSDSTKAEFVKVEQDGKKKVEKQYALNFYKNMIRATTTEGGHMPLLLGVKHAHFTTSSDMIKISVTEQDGRKSELYFKFDPKPTTRKVNKKSTVLKVINEKDKANKK